MNILNGLRSRSDLLALEDEELLQLCVELREFLVDKVSATGGHLASNLGAVELTVALHRVYDPAVDRILFDVGHQSYVHKILTGRAGEFDTLRQFGGLAGFPKPAESVCDPFVAGHASDAVSVALGMARARTLKKMDYQVVAVVGDGALTGGLSYEGLCDLGQSGEPMVVVLNDNGMAINPNVGGMASWLSRARVNPAYLDFKRQYYQVMKAFPEIRKLLHRGKEWVKDKTLPGTIFDDLGLYYMGPVDGHNVVELEKQLRWAREMGQSVLLHVTTVKGKGVPYAEENPHLFHGVGPCDGKSGRVPTGGETFSSVFGRELCRLAEKDERLCAVTAAMADGTGLADFAARFPKRFFDVGIAEEHAVALCGGMARQGLLPVFAVYSTFLQRSFDMLIEDIALMGLHAVFAVDRSGLVGADGETHQGSFDLAYLGAVPGMKIFAPASFAELRDMLRAAVEENGPAAVCYPRGCEGQWTDGWDGGAATVLREGDDLTLVCHGVLINETLRAADLLEEKGVRVEVVKLNTIEPLGTETVLSSLRKTGRLLCAGECCRSGSPGLRLLAAAAEQGCALRKARLLDLGDGVVKHGSVPQLRRMLGLDAEGMAKTVEDMLHEEDPT